MAMFFGGIISLVIYYDIILLAGLWTAKKRGFRTKNIKVKDVMLANRSIGWFVGAFTMTATWVGGVYINGAADVVANDGGLVWCQAPFGFAISLIFGGLFFADKMRDSHSVTLLDPFRWKYGDIVCCLLYLPAVCGDIFWSSCILNALGKSLEVILKVNGEVAIIISAIVSCSYTFLGGLYSVAYTDVIQLICMFFGLWLCVPFVLTHDAVGPIMGNNTAIWLGEVDTIEIASYIDNALLLICGGIPWQVFWQRVLAAKTSHVAKLLSFYGAIGCFIMSLPSVLMGIVALSTDWNATDYGFPNISFEDRHLVLPLVIKHLCPSVVTVVGLGAVSAAVMSSTDSSLLSSSSMFARNVFGVIYRRSRKVKASETAQVWAMRISQVVIAALACAIAIGVSSVHSLWFLCSDFVYVAIFPQLVCVLYIRSTNSYGSLTAFIVGIACRLLGGDNVLGIPAFVKYPWYEEATKTQMFPFRTLSMLISLFSLIVVSLVTEFLFTRQIIPLSMDVYGCFRDVPESHIEQARSEHEIEKTFVNQQYAMDENGATEV